MSLQTENLKRLFREASIDSIVSALRMVQPSTQQELMKEFGATTIEELAYKMR